MIFDLEQINRDLRPTDLAWFEKAGYPCLAKCFRMTTQSLGFKELSALCQGLEKESMALFEPELKKCLEPMDKYLEEAKSVCRNFMQD